MALARRLRLMLTGFFVTVAVLMFFNFLVNPLGAWRHRVVPDLYRRGQVWRGGNPPLLAPAPPGTRPPGSAPGFFCTKKQPGRKESASNAAVSAESPPESRQEL